MTPQENKIIDIAYVESENLQQDIERITESAQRAAYRSVNAFLVYRNWLIGKRIFEDEFKHENRQKYNEDVLASLSAKLTNKLGRGFSKQNLYNYLAFFRLFPNIFQTVSRKSFCLSWSHFCLLIHIFDCNARLWYENEAYTQGWSVRQLEDAIDSQYYFRLLKVKSPKLKEKEPSKVPTLLQEREEFIKNPLIADYLGIAEDSSFNESDLEKSILTHLNAFILELGKGYAFVARQKRITTETNYYYIDLVFYNYILKCFVLIDLKRNKISAQDVGQMDLYVRMYDDLEKQENDNPTIGLILCEETDADVAHYTALKDNPQLFAAKYKLYLPTSEELKAEIESQKSLYHQENNPGKQFDGDKKRP